MHNVGSRQRPQRSAHPVGLWVTLSQTIKDMYCPKNKCPPSFSYSFILVSLRSAILTPHRFSEKSPIPRQDIQ